MKKLRLFTLLLTLSLLLTACAGLPSGTAITTTPPPVTTPPTAPPLTSTTTPPPVTTPTTTEPPIVNPVVAEDGIVYLGKYSTDAIILGRFDYYVVTGYEGSASALEIPATYNGKPVTEVSGLSGPFESLALPASVERVTLGHCPMLTEITLDPENAHLRMESGCVWRIDEGELILTVPGFEIPEDAGIRTVAGGALRSNSIDSDFRFPDSVVYVKKDALPARLNETVDGVTYCLGWVVAAESGQERIVLREGTVGIADGALRGHTALRELVLPSTLRTLGESALEGCTALEQVTSSASLSRIYPRAFADCRALVSLVIGRDAELIGESAFLNCISLVSLTLSEESGGVQALAAALLELELTPKPDEYRIGTGAFRNCVRLEAIGIPCGVREIRANAIDNCISLVSVDFADPTHWYLRDPRSPKLTYLSLRELSEPAYAAECLLKNAAMMFVRVPNK